MLSYIAADIGTNPGASGLARRKSSLAARAIKIMTEMRDNGTIAFIGPDDTCSSEALVSAAWNLPMISYVSCLSTYKIYTSVPKAKKLLKFISIFPCNNNNCLLSFLIIIERLEAKLNRILSFRIIQLRYLQSTLTK